MSQANIFDKELGAGDLIDRAVRFYRGNFWTFVLIAAPPVVMGTLISVGWLMIGREIFAGQDHQDSVTKTFHLLFTWLGGVLIWIAEMVASLVVMGGASRNFVRHLLFGEAIKFKDTYANTWKRLPALVLASTLIAILLSVVGIVIFYLGLTVFGIAILIIFWAFNFSPFLMFIFSVIFGVAAAFGTLWLFFLLASRFTLAPQIMLVENLGVFAAIGRSASLASGNVKRLAALFVFTTVASYSAVSLLYVPLLWAAWINGVEVTSFNTDLLPAWYSVGTQIVWQASLILLLPVWMIGLCLLYVDERVHNEGYDIELMAARQLGEIPAVPQDFTNPLHPALATAQTNFQPPSPKKSSDYSVLGLK